MHKPYNLTIVVHLAENRLLTDVFRERIKRDLQDGFQVALGDRSRVNVTYKHDRLADVLARGLLRSLDEWTERGDQKTHFVLIDYIDGHYEIQTRQYDSTIGRASPVVRRDRTRDRAFVAKAAALLIKQDFGILGTVLSEPDPEQELVSIELRGGALGDMTRWVEKGDIFAVAPPDGSKPLELRFSLLRVEQAPSEDARNGICQCRFFHRWKVQSIAGYRCIKLGTVQAPLRLRWIQQMPGGKSKPPDGKIYVDIRRHGFEGEEASTLHIGIEPGDMRAVEDKGKIVQFNNVAFVSVISGPVADPKPRIPIALVDDQPIFIEVTAASNDSRALFSLSLSEWKIRVGESLQMQTSLRKTLAGLPADPANRARSIQLAKSSMKRSKRDREQLLADRRKLAADSGNERKFKTPVEDQRIAQLEKNEQDLAEFIAKLEKIEEEENDPKQKQWLSDIENANLLEKELEIDKAIEIYDRVIREGYKNPKLDEHLAKIHRDWDLREKKGVVDKKQHGEARGFIYRVWPDLNLTRLEEKLPEARKAFDVCKDVDDLITIQKLLKGTERHADQLAKRLEELRTVIRIADDKEREQLQKVSLPLAKLGEDIQDYLKAHANDK